MICVVPYDNANRCKRSQTIQLMQTIQFAAPGDPWLAVHMLNHPGQSQVGESLSKVAGACMSICRKWAGLYAEFFVDVRPTRFGAAKRS